ncbi:MAG: hypothetical protein Q4D81_06205 [Eubacteriales bacterium]|nr:hypothetical protein [Eubacteriales bacterium]
MSQKNKENNLTVKISRWLDSRREEIAGKVLCAGIPAAAASHLAHMLPEISVVCLTGEEVSDAGAVVPGGARGLREPLYLSADPADYAGGLFDTVLLLQETPLADRSEDPAFPRWERGTLYLRRAQLLMDYYEKEVRTVCRHLKPGGRLFCLVRAQHDEHLLGWCLALAAEGMEIVSADTRQILCREDGRQSVLQGIFCVSGGRTDIGLLLANHLNYRLDRMNTGAEELHGQDAEILLQADIASLLRGFHIYQGDSCRGKLAVYSSAQRPDVIYYYTDVEGDEPYLRRFHEQDRDKVIRHMVGELHRQKAVDKSISWKTLTLGEDWNETE